MLIAESIMPQGAYVVECHDRRGLVIHRETGKNLIFDIGRRDGLRGLFTALPSALFQYMGADATSLTPLATEIGMPQEITTNSIPAGSLSTRPLCTNTSLATLSNSDVVFDSGTSPYREKVILQAVYATTDMNGTVIGGFGLFNSATMPVQTVASANPSAGSSVLISVPSTAGFVNGHQIIISGNTAGGVVQEIQTITAIGVGTSITVGTLANTYTAHPTLSDPTSSGDNYNRFALGTPITKASSFSITVQITIRY